MAVRAQTQAKWAHAGSKPDGTKFTVEQAKGYSDHVRLYVERRQALTPAELKSIGVAKKNHLLVTGAQLGEIKRKAEAESKPARKTTRSRKGSGKAVPAQTASKLDIAAIVQAAVEKALAEAQA